MFNKLSFKIGLLFFVFILLIESFLFFILYTTLVDERVNEVISSLLARGNTHRDVLEDHYDSSTLEHVGIMESASEFIVIITDETDDIIISSDPLDDGIESMIAAVSRFEVPKEGQVIEHHWEEEKYIATGSTIRINDEYKGNVFMFVDTDYVKKIVNQLRNQFLIASMVTILFTIITIFILSRFITQPLIQMKKATEQLSEGYHDVQLNTKRKDELGELANSIQKLSMDLKNIKMARNEFLASIAHELRTPLTYIKGYADIIKRSEQDIQSIDEYIAIIHEEAEQLAMLINNLFQLARIDENAFLIHKEYVNLSELMNRVYERIRPSLKEKNLSLSIHCQADLHVYLDEDRFQQVLINVLDNATKHSKPNGTIQIDAQARPTCTVITIEDEGEGIPEGDLPYIFDRLYRAEKSRSRKSGGSGLGLAIAKEIINAHGGTIHIESKVNVGTKVIIKLDGDNH